MHAVKLCNAECICQALCTWVPRCINNGDGSRGIITSPRHNILCHKTIHVIVRFPIQYSKFEFDTLLLNSAKFEERCISTTYIYTHRPCVDSKGAAVDVLAFRALAVYQEEGCREVARQQPLTRYQQRAQVHTHPARKG